MICSVLPLISPAPQRPARHGQWQPAGGPAARSVTGSAAAEPTGAVQPGPPVTGDQSVVTGRPTGSLSQCQGPGGTESESLQGTGSAPQFTPYHSTYVFSCIYTYMYVYVGICKYMHVSARISMALAENTLSTNVCICTYLYVLVRTVYLSACICWYMCI